MKKASIFALTAALWALSLSACSQDGKPEETSVFNAQQPPELILAPLGDAALTGEFSSAQPDNYSWSWSKGRGKRESVEACGMGPTDPALPASREPLALEEATEYQLLWPTAEPDSVLVLSWDSTVYQLPGDVPESLVEEFRRDATLTEDPEDGTRQLLLEPDRIYDIRAQWPEAEEAAFGDAHYYVITESRGSALHLGPLAGGWAVSDSAEITPERQAIFDKALEGFVGVGYQPVAYLGSQVVAGTNHAFLCRAQGVYPGAVPYYTMAYVYQDLSGGARFLGFQEITLGQMS